MSHPLDPLSADEFSVVADVLRRDHGVGPGWRFASIEMLEPGKAEVAAFDAGGDTPARRAVAVCLDRSANATYKGVVSVTDRRTESFDHVPGVQPNFTVDEFTECDQVLRAHPEVVAALARRGITDVDTVFMDTWTYGAAVIPEEFRGRRLGWSDTWCRDAPGANPYAHLVSGLHCVIDLNSMEVLRVEDDGPFAGGAAQLPSVMGEYVPRLIPDPVGVATGTVDAVAHHPARRSVVHARRQPAAMAELVVPGRVQLPRGHDTAHRALPRR